MAERALRIVRKWNYEKSGVDVPAGVTYDEWRSEFIGRQQDRRSGLFWIGDLANGGEERFGELYADAVLDYSRESLQTAMRVCRQIPRQRRRDEVSFRGHQAVGKYPAHIQDDILDKAVRFGWTSEAIRDEVKRIDAEAEAVRMPRRTPEPEPEPEPDPDSEYDSSAGARSASDADAQPQTVRSLSYPITPIASVTPIVPEPLWPALAEFAAATAPMDADSAAEMLDQLGRAALPSGIGQAIEILLAERRRFLELLRRARLAREMKFLSPGFLDCLAEFDSD